MDMDYFEVFCKIIPYKREYSEILAAKLALKGYESFMDHENGLFAYIPSVNFDESALNDMAYPENVNYSVSFEKKLIKQKNWNEEWERNFKAVVVDDKCMVRAPFHEKDQAMQYDVIIEPKMSFGTAHHETTQLMIKLLLKEDLLGKKALDMGCGTGVLAILAKKLGAESVMAIDNDEWAYENAQSNVLKNNCNDIVVHFGDATLLENEKFDIILANINRNILLNDISVYDKVLNKPGVLLISGFYKEDLELIKQRTTQLNLKIDHYEIKNNWIAASIKK